MCKIQQNKTDINNGVGEAPKQGMCSALAMLKTMALHAEKDGMITSTERVELMIEAGAVRKNANIVGISL